MRGRLSSRPPPVMWARPRSATPARRQAGPAQVAAVGLQQLVDQLAGGDLRAVLVEQVADQRVAVGVRPGGGQRDQQVAFGHVAGAGQDVVPLDDADDRAGHVERAGGVDAGHLGRLARRAARSPPPGRLRPCPSRPRPRSRARGGLRPRSPGRTAGRAPCTRMSLTQWLTRSAPMPRQRPPASAASFTLVPTPSVEATSTGSSPSPPAANSPPKAPTSESTRGV